MKSCFGFLLAGALALHARQLDRSKPCAELVTTLYPWLNGRDFPPQQGRIEIRCCQPELQLVAYGKHDAEGPSLVDTDGLGMGWLILARNVLFSVMQGPSRDLVRVLTLDDKPHLAFEDVTNEDIRAEVSEREARFTVGEHVVEFKLAAPPEASLVEEPLPDYRELMKRIPARRDKPQAWKPPALCREVVTKLYADWHPWLAPRDYQPRIEIRRCQPGENETSLQLVVWTALAFGPAAVRPVRGTIGTMVLAGNVFLLVTHNGRRQLLYLARYHRGSAEMGFAGELYVADLKIEVTTSHVTVWGADEVRRSWMERFPTGQ
jgi:hypothetical protein